MSFADIRIVLIIVMFAGIYGVFNFLHANETVNKEKFSMNTTETYNTPSTGNFFDSLNKMVKVSTSTPELLFINVTLFAALSAALVFVGLRFLRGTG